MSHYNVDYSECPDEITKHNKAISDIKDYLETPERFNTLTEHLKKYPKMETFSFICSFAGIQGYPVKALYNYCHPL